MCCVRWCAPCPAPAHCFAGFQRGLGGNASVGKTSAAAMGVGVFLRALFFGQRDAGRKNSLSLFFETCVMLALGTV